MAAIVSELSNFDRFAMKLDYMRDSTVRYSQVIADTSLAKDCPAIQVVTRKYRNVSGIYFWVMQVEDKSYSIYIGKTKSLAKRVTDYINDFQPHAPNDYKLKVFQRYITQIEPQAKLKLFFLECREDCLTITEREEIKNFRPLLNLTQRRIPDEARTVLKVAFSNYYTLMFQSFLK